jgi:hypothetical protein
MAGSGKSSEPNPMKARFNKQFSEFEKNLNRWLDRRDFKSTLRDFFIASAVNHLLD